MAKDGTNNQSGNTDDDNDEDGSELTAKLNEVLSLVKGGSGSDNNAAVTALNQTLMGENAKHRARIRDLKKEVHTLRQGAPAEGAVVLLGDEVKLWEGYKALNQKPDEIKGLMTRVTDAETTEVVTKAAEALSWKSSVLKDLVKTKGLKVEVRTEKQDDETINVPYVIATENGTETASKLADYAPLKDYHAALEAGEHGGEAKGKPNSTPVLTNARSNTKTNRGGKSETNFSGATTSRLASRYAQPGKK